MIDNTELILQKLCIGTVQFGIPYGINNTSGLVSSSMISQILEIASENNISFLDTAFGYGEAEKQIGELSGGKFNIVTKFSSDNEESLLLEFRQSLERLEQMSVYGYVAHNADILIKNNALWDTLQMFKEQKLVHNIGFSLYTPEQLEKLIDMDCIPDLVQIPYSILDRKFEKYLANLKSLGVEIHVRSVFLQGLYYMDPYNLPENLKDLSEELQKLHNYCHDYGVAIGALALNIPMRNSFIDKVVIGVDTARQLQQNIDSILSWEKEDTLLQKITEIEVKKKELLNPANWN